MTKSITLSQDELEMNMRLLGAQTIKDVVPDMIDVSTLSMHVAATPGDRLYDNNCEFITQLYLSGTNISPQMKPCNMPS
jgi:L-lactate dehydrogenase (cytochrome)